MENARGYNEEERLDALHSLEILHSARLQEYDAVVETVAEIFDCPIALISLVAKEDQWFKARCGLDADGTSRDVSFCQHTILFDDLLIVPDALEDERFKENPLVTGEPHIRFYAGCPLSIDGRNRLGTLCVIGRKPQVPSDSQLRQLRRLGKIVEGLFKAHRAEIETREALLEAEVARRKAVSEGELIEEIANLSGVGGWEVDIAANILTWTDKTREIHEVDPDFVPNINEALSFYPPDSRDKINKAVHDGIENNVGWDIELPLVTAKQRHIWVRAVGRPITEDGSVTRIVGAFQNITERKLSEQAIQHSEAVQRTTLEALSEGILLLSRSGNIQSANPAALEILGFAGMDVTGKCVSYLSLDFKCSSPDSKDCTDPLALAARDPDAVTDFVVSLKLPQNPHKTWLRLNAEPIDPQHEYGLDDIVVSLADITESKQQAETLKVVFDNFTGGFAHYDENYRLASCNAEFQRLLGYPQDMIDQKLHLLEFLKFNAERGDLGPGVPEELAQERFELVVKRKALNYERQTLSGHFLEVRSTPLPTGGGIYNFFDVTARKHMEGQLAENERLARHRLEELEVILANMRQGVSVFDNRGHLTLWNRQYIEIFGKPEGEVHDGVSLTDLLEAEEQRGEFSGNVHDHVMDLFTRMTAGEVVRSKFTHPDGKIISSVQAPLPDGGWIGTHEDITLNERAAQKIAHAAHHDPLTGLANRSQFNLKLEEALEKAATLDKRGNLMLLDLDKFKPINDTYGHDAGDELLKLVSKRLQDCVRSTDLVARLGGDEFAIILSGTGPTDFHTSEIAGRIVEKLHSPFKVQGQSVSVGISIGIASIDGQTQDAGAVFKSADIALYEVKKNGRNGFKFFEELASRRTVNG
ncbi:sensor domain-containing diguanylate cyclase [Roseibium marinum]|uniref:PAS domain S-box-containing protein/diguanylate cyclase (GGDEF)-like protein n=1 Tax=Roseibium marinum TaxID=281252 RepID=A0A2S3V287_9HYPH|nr:PAS-domain containing protein [Roseibium marinum]POF34092.1 PAS domain S-box-containing protein/diguanylate cyclase (GGDEF)-like protein [Roseibium marinum]